MSGSRITDAFSVLFTGEQAGSASAAAFQSVRGKWAKFKAAVDNSGNVYIGIASTVTKADGTTDATTGWVLDAGQETDWLPIPSGDLANFYRITDNAGDDTLIMVMG